MRNTLGSWAVLVGVLFCHGAIAKEKAGPPAKPAGLFQTDRVWNVHLRFTPEEWAAMEPKGAGGGGMFGGRLGGPGGPGGPGGRGGFGPAMFLAPTFMRGDLNKDRKLSADEFAALGDGWFAQWDKAKSGKLSADAIKAGLDATVAMPAVGMRLQGAEGQRNGLAASMGIEFAFVHADLEFEGQTLKDVGVRYKGNGTWMQSQGQLKRSMKIDLNHFVKGQKLAGVAKLNLHNNVTDASWMNEVLSHRLYRDAGVPAPRTAYARVYVTVPGKHERQYFGLYSIVEDVDKHFAAEQFKAKDGAIFKPVSPSLFADRGDDWAKYKQTYDPKTELTEAQQRRVIDFARLVTAADDARFAAEVGNYLDLDEFARFMAVTSWLSTMDSILAMGQNFCVYLDPRTNRFQFLPWDLDHSFGQFGMQGSQEDREQLSIRQPWRGENRFLARVFKVDAFMKVYLARYAELEKGVLAPERFHKQVDEVAKAIRPAVQEESATMLARFDKVVAGEAVEPPQRMGGGGIGGRGMAAKPIKGFVTARAKSVAEQLAGTSEGRIMDGGGFGGGRGGGGQRGGFGPGTMLSPAILAVMDADKDGQLTREEFKAGFAKWFGAWNVSKSGLMTEEELRAGIDKDLAPNRGGGGGFLQRLGGFGGGRGQ